MNYHPPCLLPRFIGMNLLKRDKFIDETGTYDLYHMFLLLEGSFICGEANDEVFPGNVVIFPPNEIFKRKVSKPITFLSIHFDLDTTETCKEYLPGGVLNFIDKERIISTAKLMIKTESISMLNHYLTDILYQYLTESFSTSQHSNETVISAVNTIKDADLSGFSVSDLADFLGISHAHLIYLFKAHLGKTPVDYITDLKLQKARALLADTDYPIQKIAEICGFANLYYFSRVFKSKTGLPPSEFRRIYRA